MRARPLQKWAFGRRSIFAAAAVVIGLSLAATGTSSGIGRAGAASAPKYLLAVGDSLAAGYQPIDRATLPPIDAASGFRDQGYPGGYASSIASAEGLSLVDLACPGETTASMLATPAQALCAKLYEAEFGAASQISAIGSFLSRNRGRVGLVTIDIGANDLDRCQSTSSVKVSCLQSADVAVVKNLARILTVLVASVHRFDPSARIAGMDYYDPFLGLEFSPGGIKGDELALGSIAATNALNTELNATFHTYGVTAVDVATAFRINAVTPLVRFANKTVPQDVASTCQLTWMCPSAGRQAADIHPNTTGYRLIAATFEKRLGS